MRFFVQPGLLVLCFFFFVSCDNEKAEAPSKKMMLTAGSVKRWKITSISPEEEHISCRVESVRNGDNYWIFFENGDFEFENGEITEDPACTEEDNCCSDLLDLYGTWQFTDGEKKLVIKAIGLIEGDTRVEVPEEDRTELFNDTFTLSEKELVLSDPNGTAKFTPAP